MRKINVINPRERTWTKRNVLFAFGACAPTYVLVYGNSLEDCLEDAASWLAEHAPGHIIAHDSDALRDLMGEACRDLGVNPAEPGSPDYDAAWEQATADLTYTEAGYLTSYEWFIVGENMTPAKLRAFVEE